MRSRIGLGLGLLLLLAAAAFVIQMNTPAAQTYVPAQRDLGAQVYAGRCATCHGDKGQGLTLEWRLTWPETHQNCSTPRCHGPQHPPDGFEIKDNYAPALVGPGTLARFQTAQELFDFISTRMPMHAPGTLSQDEYWALTAFLLATHGVPPAGETPLDKTTAGRVNLAESLTTEALSQQPWWRKITPAPQVIMQGMSLPEPHPTSPGAAP